MVLYLADSWPGIDQLPLEEGWSLHGLFTGKDVDVEWSFEPFTGCLLDSENSLLPRLISL